MKYKVIIPARLESTRLARKVLRDIAGKTMLQHVYDQAIKSKASEVIIAVDHEEVAAKAKSFGAKICFTDVNHPSGTARISEAVALLGLADDDIVVNVQADEPLIPPELIDQLAADLVNHVDASMATLYEPIHDNRQIFNPGNVKVALDKNGYALYFSRSTIPWDKSHIERHGVPLQHYHRHVGVYAYRVALIKRYANWEPSPLEKLENLEQLRVLWHGERIHAVCALKESGVEVNTEEDLEEVRKILSRQSAHS